MSPWLADAMAALAAVTLPLVLVVLTVMSAVTLVLTGGFVAEWRRRRVVHTALGDALGARGNDERMAALLRAGALPACFARGLERSDDVARALTSVRAHAAATVAPLTFLTRVGPMCGLVATLLPLGPALEALAVGNLADTASELTVAFTATVVGLLVSCASYLLGLVRRTWYARDYGDLEAIAERLRPPAQEVAA